MSDFPHIALVDDEEAVVEILGAAIRKNFPNGRVTGFSKPTDAWDWLALNPVDILLTDLCMPDMDGRDLVTMIRQCAPETPVFVISGAYSKEDLATLETEFPGVRVFTKPIYAREVIAAIKEALARHDLPSDSQLQGLDLLNLLQMLNLQKKTIEVVITTSDLSGRLVMKSGEPIWVECGNDLGVEAFFRLLSLKETEAVLTPPSYTGPDRMPKTFAQLLSEFCERRTTGRLV